MFNKNGFNPSYLALSIILTVTVFDKFKLNNLNIKVPGLIEIVESNKKINKNIEKIVNIKTGNKLLSEQNNAQEAKAQAVNIQTKVVNYYVNSDLPIKIEDKNKKSGEINLIN